MPWGDHMLWSGVPGVSLGPVGWLWGGCCGVAVALSVLQQGGPCCSPCIVLSSKVKKPAKKQPSELSRKPNQKEKRGRAEEKPRNKSASAHLPPSPWLLAVGLFLHSSSPSTPGWGWGSAPAEGLGLFLPSS